MAYDGVTISGVVRELKQRAVGGRINKIQQPENDEIDLFIKNGKDNNLKLMLSANASLPLCYITDSFKPAPLTAPGFCMLLRKHIGNGRITDIVQPGFDRIIEIHIEHLDEMGDVRHKRLIIELMGRHSNIIFVNDDGRIIDSVKRVPLDVSRVRQVLPGMDYEIPKTDDKADPRTVDRTEFESRVFAKAAPLAKSISQSFNGIAVSTSNEIVLRAGIEDRAAAELGQTDKDKLWTAYSDFFKLIEEGEMRPVIYFEQGQPKDYSVVPFGIYGGYESAECDSVSDMLLRFYKLKNEKIRINQKTTDLRHIISTAVERTVKKLDLQRTQMKDTEDREKLRIYGELLNTYGYSLNPGDKELKCVNYYDNTEVTIPIPEGCNAIEASQKYFERYNKKKRTFIALEELLLQSEQELEYLQSVKHSLEIATDETDINDIRLELVETGIIKGSRADRAGGKKKGARLQKSRMLHYVSSDGFDMFVGKNNIQNDELTFKVAAPYDMWFHAKKAPGSHVIVRRNKGEELPDATYEEAARLAAFYSSVKDSPKVEIDYTERKNLKKPPSSNPGFVIYHTNYSMMAIPDISGIKEELS